LVADGRGIHLLASDGTTQMVYRPLLPGRRWACHEPRPLRSRPREPVIADRIQLGAATGQFVLSDVYRGRNMKGVKRGEIKELLVLEQLPKPANFSGGQEPLTIGGTFTLQRILGTVPVEADGSASFEVPALKSVFFVALDANGDSVKRMQSFVTVQPGEKVSCVGCHEPRTQSPHSRQRPALLAADRAPSKIMPIKDMPDVLDYPRDVQPILDRHCIRCHNVRQRPKGINLSGDRTPFYSISYWTMFTHGLVSDGRNGRGNKAPRTVGTSASPLAKIIEGHDGRVKMSEKEKQTIRLWIESGVVYPGTYGALGSGMVAVKYPHEVMKQRCATCHEAKEKSYRNVKKDAFYYQFGARKPPQPLWDNPNDITMIRHLAYFQLGESRLYQAFCNMDHPEDSLLLLAPLAKSAGGLQLCGETPVFESTDDPDYQQILAAIQAAAKELQTVKRFDMPDFRPSRFYIREMQNYGLLPADLPADVPVNPYTTDQAYWRTFRYLPE
jgi:cytochrome c553